MASRPNPTVAPSERAPDLEIVGDNVILHQTAVAGGSEALSGITERRLVSNMARFRENPFEFLREVSLFVSGSGWRAYDDVIGPPVFYSGYSDKMKQDIAKQPMLRAKISELAETRANVEQKEGLLDLPTRPGDNPHLHRKSEIESQLQQVCDEMMDKMVCKMENKRFIRGAYYLATQLLTRAYHQGKKAGLFACTRSVNIVKVFMYQVKRSSVCGLWLARLPRSGNRLFSFPLTSPILTICLYKLSATGLTWCCLSWLPVTT